MTARLQQSIAAAASDATENLSARSSPPPSVPLHLSTRDPLSARVRVRSPSKSARYAGGQQAASGGPTPAAAQAQSLSLRSLPLVRASPPGAVPAPHPLALSTGGALPTFAAMLLHPHTHPDLLAVRSGSLQRQQAAAQLATAASVYAPLAAAAGLPGRPWLQHSRSVASLSEAELRALRKAIFLSADVQLLLLLFWQLAVPKRRADAMLSFAGFKSIYMRVQKRLLGPAYRAKDVAARCEEQWARDWGGVYPGASREFSVVQGLPVQNFISSLFDQVDAYISSPSSGGGSAAPGGALARGQGPAMLSVPLGHNSVTIPLPCPERYVAALERLLKQVTWRTSANGDADQIATEKAGEAPDDAAAPTPATPSAPPEQSASTEQPLHTFRLRELPQVSTADFDAPDADADPQACRAFTLTAVYSLLQHPESVYQRQLRQPAASSGRSRPASPASPPPETAEQSRGSVAALHQPLPSASASGNLRTPRAPAATASAPGAPSPHRDRADADVDAHDDPEAVAEESHSSLVPGPPQAEQKDPAGSLVSTTPVASRSVSPSKQLALSQSGGARDAAAGRAVRLQQQRSPVSAARTLTATSLRITGTGTATTSSPSAASSAQSSPRSDEHVHGADALAAWDHRADSGDEEEVEVRAEGATRRATIASISQRAETAIAATAGPAPAPAPTWTPSTPAGSGSATLSIASPRQSKRKSALTGTGTGVGASPRRPPTLEHAHSDFAAHSPRMQIHSFLPMQGRATPGTTAATVAPSTTAAPGAPAATLDEPLSAATPVAQPGNNGAAAPSPAAASSAVAVAVTASPGPSPSVSHRSSLTNADTGVAARAKATAAAAKEPVRPRFKSLVSMALAASRATGGSSAASGPGSVTSSGGSNAFRRSQSKKNVAAAAVEALMEAPVPPLKVVDHTSSLLASLRSLVNLGAKSISAHLDALKRREEEQAAAGTATAAPSVAPSAAVSAAPSTAPSAPASAAASPSTSRDLSRSSSPALSRTPSRRGSLALPTDGAPPPAKSAALHVAFDLQEQGVEEEETETEGTENREEETDVVAEVGGEEKGSAAAAPDPAAAADAPVPAPTLSAEAEVDALFGLVASAHEARKTTKSGVTILIEQAQQLHAASNMQLDELPQFIVDAAAEASATPAQRRARLAAQAAAAAAQAQASRTRSRATSPSKSRASSPKKLRASEKQNKMALTAAATTATTTTTTTATITNAAPTTGSAVAPLAEESVSPAAAASPSPPTTAATEPVSIEQTAAPTPLTTVSGPVAAGSVGSSGLPSATLAPADSVHATSEPAAATAAAAATASTAATVVVAVSPAEQPAGQPAIAAPETTSGPSADVALETASTGSRVDPLSRAHSAASVLAAAAAAHQSLQDTAPASASAASRSNWHQSQLVQAKSSRDEAREEARMEAELAAQLRRIKTKELRLAETRARENRQRARATRVSISQQEGEELRRQLAAERAMREIQHAQEVAIKRAAVKAPRILVSAGASPALVAAAASALTIATAAAIETPRTELAAVTATVAEQERPSSGPAPRPSSRPASRSGSGSRSRERPAPGSPLASPLGLPHGPVHAGVSGGGAHARKGSSVLGGGGSGRGHKRFATAFEELLSSINDVDPMVTAVAAATRSGLTTLLPSIAANGGGGGGEELFAHLETIAEPIVTARPPVEGRQAPADPASASAAGSAGVPGGSPPSAFAAAERAVLRREAAKARAREEEARRVAVYAALAHKRHEASMRKQKKKQQLQLQQHEGEGHPLPLHGSVLQPESAAAPVAAAHASAPPQARPSMAAMVADAFAAVSLEDQGKAVPFGTKHGAGTEQKEKEARHQPAADTAAAVSTTLAILPSHQPSAAHSPPTDTGPAPTATALKHPRAAAPSARKSNAPLRTQYQLVHIVDSAHVPVAVEEKHAPLSPLPLAVVSPAARAGATIPVSRAEAAPEEQQEEGKEEAVAKAAPLAPQTRQSPSQADELESKEPTMDEDADFGAAAAAGDEFGPDSVRAPPGGSAPQDDEASSASWRRLEDALAHSTTPGEVLDLQRLIHALRSSTHGARGAVADPSARGAAARIHPHLYSSKFALPARRLIDRWTKQPALAVATATEGRKGRRGRARKAQEAADALATEEVTGAEGPSVESSGPSSPRTLSPLRVAAAAAHSPNRAAAVATAAGPTALPHAHRLHLPPGALPLKEPTKRPFALAALSRSGSGAAGGGGGHSASAQLLPTHAALIARSQTVFSNQVLPLVAPLVPHISIPLGVSVSASASAAALPSAFSARRRAQTDRRPAAPAGPASASGSQSSRAHGRRAAQPHRLSSSLARPPAAQVDLRTLERLRPPVYAPPLRTSAGAAVSGAGATGADAHQQPSRIQKDLYAFMASGGSAGGGGLSALDALPSSLPPVMSPAAAARDAALLAQLSLHLERHGAPRLMLRPEDAFDPASSSSSHSDGSAGTATGAGTGALARHIDLASSARREVFRTSQRFEPASENVATPATEPAYAHHRAQELRARIALARGELHSSANAHAKSGGDAPASMHDGEHGHDHAVSSTSSIPAAAPLAQSQSPHGSDDEWVQHGSAVDLASRAVHTAAGGGPRSNSSSRKSARPRPVPPARPVSGGTGAAATAAPAAASPLPSLQPQPQPQQRPPSSSRPASQERRKSGGGGGSKHAAAPRRRTSSSPSARPRDGLPLATKPAATGRDGSNGRRSGSRSASASKQGAGPASSAPPAASSSSSDLSASGANDPLASSASSSPASGAAPAALSAAPSSSSSPSASQPPSQPHSPAFAPSSPLTSPAAGPGRGHSRRISSLKGSRPASREALTVSFAAQGDV